MKTLRSTLSFCFCVFVLSGCAATPKVFTDYDPAQSFGEYQTFTWLGADPMVVTGDRSVSPLAAKRLKTAIRTELTTRGFTFTDDADDADFAVAFTVGARERMDVREREVLDYYGPHWRWGYSYYYGIVRPPVTVRTEVDVRDYVEGSLAIDIFDVGRKSPVWHADATKRLSRADLREKSAENIKRAVAVILEGFPPTASQ
ncbi:MAG: DUF4136 domain-containing protein [Pseudomonadota bacterium]